MGTIVHGTILWIYGLSTFKQTWQSVTLIHRPLGLFRSVSIRKNLQRVGGSRWFKHRHSPAVQRHRCWAFELLSSAACLRRVKRDCSENNQNPQAQWAQGEINSQIDSKCASPILQLMNLCFFFVLHTILLLKCPNWRPAEGLKRICARLCIQGLSSVASSYSLIHSLEVHSFVVHRISPYSAAKKDALYVVRLD